MHTNLLLFPINPDNRLIIATRIFFERDVLVSPTTRPDIPNPADLPNSNDEEGATRQEMLKKAAAIREGHGDDDPDPFVPEPNRPDIDPGVQNHIIDGEVKPDGSKASGAHYPNSVNVKIDPNWVTNDSGGSGVFTANVEICCDANGNFVTNTCSSKNVNSASIMARQISS